MVYANLGWLCSHAIPLLVFLVICLYVTRMAISLMYCILECIAGCFQHYPSGGDCIHSVFLCLACRPFFDDVKRGKMGMNLFG